MELTKLQSVSHETRPEGTSDFAKEMCWSWKMILITEARKRLLIKNWWIIMLK